MSTFLELCQKVAEKSGTFTGIQPSSVADQTGRLLKVVNFTSEAWVQIQNEYETWRWMRAEFSKDLTAATARYTAASFSLTDFADWYIRYDKNYGRWNLWLYKTSTGVSDDGPINFIPWEVWLARYGRGSQTNNRPIEFSISPALELCFGAIPDDTYTVRGEYRKTAQVLSDNSDTPECPSRFHDIIAWKALMDLLGHDEADLPLYAWANRAYEDLMANLRRDQLPRISIGGGPLA